MENKLGTGIIISTIIITIILILPNAYSTIPPTRAFDKIVTSNATIQADNSTAKNYITSDVLGVTGNDQTNTLILTGLQLPFGQFSSSATQTVPSNGNAGNITLNTNDEIYKITHNTVTKSHEIKIQESGVYMVLAGGQIGTEGLGGGTHNLWLAKNGQSIANSNVKTYIATVPVDTSVVLLNWVGTLNKNDIIYFQQSGPSNTFELLATGASSPVPATPSIIVSIVKISN